MMRWRRIKSLLGIKSPSCESLPKESINLLKVSGLEHVMLVMLDKGAYMPARAHEDDAGLDLMSPVDAVIPARGYVKIDLGVHCEIPKGHFGKLESRSGMMSRGVTTMGGVIDCNYRGSISVLLENHNDYDIAVHKGDKVTQMIVQPMLSVYPETSIYLEDTDRGSDGFGSTGR